jgi:hypothetical protein
MIVKNEIHGFRKYKKMIPLKMVYIPVPKED